MEKIRLLLKTWNYAKDTPNVSWLIVWFTRDWWLIKTGNNHQFRGTCLQPTILESCHTQAPEVGTPQNMARYDQPGSIKTLLNIRLFIYSDIIYLSLYVIALLMFSTPYYYVPISRLFSPVFWCATAQLYTPSKVSWDFWACVGPEMGTFCYLGR